MLSVTRAPRAAIPARAGRIARRRIAVRGSLPRQREAVPSPGGSPDRPTILFSTGYEVPLTARRTEPTVLLDGNQLGIEHRFFGASRPTVDDFTHLTIRQAADDHHRVVQLFRRIYPGAWISTGGSKGGMASVHHRRFHPHDVDGTVAYSAPNNVDDHEDSAYVRFLERVGPAATRDALKAAQREVLLRRTHLVARYEAWAAAAHDTFRIIGSADPELHSLLVPTRHPDGLPDRAHRSSERTPEVPERHRTPQLRVRWVEGGNHHVTIAGLSPGHRTEAVAALHRWVNGPAAPARRWRTPGRDGAGPDRGANVLSAW
ncbi:S28 family serine protease [Streptomyces sp. NPDC059816]|uniref:S28 family serine protease n=1 Tax=Streptomyces sp. NPDC059816 TaxID=3346960 RepID=UPI00365966B8